MDFGNDKNSEFIEFLSSPEVSPPTLVRDSIFAKVHSDLFPSFERVFLKVLAVHSVVSLFSLSICSQFGIQTFQLTDMMNTFMGVVGHAYCMFLCGALYLGLSAIALSALPRPEEIRAIRRHRVLQFTLLSGVSMGVFLCIGSGVLFAPAFLWMLGSILSAILALEIGWNVRVRFALGGAHG